jgi:replicative DNA helicase
LDEKKKTQETMSIPAEYQGSPAFQLVMSQGWTYREASSPNIEIEACPYCKHSNYHFRMEIHGAGDADQNRDGLHMCHHCGKGGNLFSLKDKLKLVNPAMESTSSYGGSKGESSKMEEMPDFEAMHEALLADDPAMDYLINGRGFSREIVEKQKLGLTKRYFRECGEVRALVYPYLVNQNAVFMHFRTLPIVGQPGKVPKAFSSLKGWDVPLYNGEILREGLKEVFFVEGEANCIAALDHGVTDICGVPGANFKKADWIDTLDRIGVEKVYICYDKDKVGQKAAQTLAARIGIEKCWKIVLPDFDVVTDEGKHRKGKDLNEWFVSGGGTAEALQKLKEDARLFDVDGVASSHDSVQEFYEDLLGNGVEPKYQTAWPTLNKVLGIDEGDVIDILAPEKVGKFLESTTYIIMRDGSKKMIRDLVVGDQVASIDGKESYVTGVYPQGVQPIMRCSFADGRSVLAGKPHLWQVDGVNPWENGPRVMTTDGIQQDHCNGRHHSKVHIPLASGDYGCSATLPIDPWALGALIGDGSFVGGSPSFTTVDEYMARKLEKKVAERGDVLNATGIHRDTWKNGHVKASSQTLKKFMVSGGELGNSTTEALRKLGLWGHKANSKFIPKVYLEADKESRWELLRGLMDTDGTAGNKNGTPSYCTISKQLAEDFVYLVRSLGGLAKVGKPQNKSFRYKGELRTGQDAYIIVARFPAAVRRDVFSLERKRKLVNQKDGTNDPRLTFEKIEYVGEHEAVCISVSHPSKLYITDDFIVTHNTTFGLNIMEHMVSAYGEDGVIICLEMTRARMARKWICHVTGIEDNIPKSSEEATFLKDQFMDAIPKVQAMAGERKGTLYFCYPKYSTKEEIYDLMKDCIRRYGVKWIMIDNIQRLADTTSSAKGTNRTEHLSQISKVTSQIAKDYNIQMIRILQPHRIMVGKMVTTDNVDGSSQIAKDCDCMVTLHRNRKAELTQEQFDQLQHIESDGAFETGMVVTAGLTRYSQGGTTTLEYDGARSTVLERNETIKSKIKDSHKVEDQGSKIAALKAATAPALAQPPIAPGKAPEAAVTPVAPQSAVSAEDGGEITV